MPWIPYNISHVAVLRTCGNHFRMASTMLQNQSQSIEKIFSGERDIPLDPLVRHTKIHLTPNFAVHPLPKLKTPCTYNIIAPSLVFWCRCGGLGRQGGERWREVVSVSSSPPAALVSAAGSGCESLWRVWNSRKGEKSYTVDVLYMEEVASVPGLLYTVEPLINDTSL